MIQYEPLTAARYAELMQDMLPNGDAWPADEDSNWRLFFSAIAEEMARVDAEFGSMLEEVDPRTTIEALELWEASRGLPDECSDLATTVQARRNVLVNRVVAVGNQSTQRFIDTAASLGFNSQVVNYNPGDTVPGNPVAPADAGYVVQVDLPDSDIVSEFYAGESFAGDPLDEYETPERLICEYERFIHAHLVLHITLGNI